MSRQTEEGIDPVARATPMLVCLSGSLKGCTLRPEGLPIVLGSDGACTVRFPPSKKRPVAPRHAELFRDGDAWHVRSLIDDRLVVNDEEVTSAPLQQNDLFRLGRDGPLLRFRLSSGEGITKSFRQMLLDSSSLCRGDVTKTPIRHATEFARRLAFEAAHHGTRRFRWAATLSLVAIVGISGFLVWRAYQEGERDQRIEDLRRSVEMSGRDLEQREQGLRSDINQQDADIRARLDRESDERRTREQSQILALEKALSEIVTRRDEDQEAIQELMTRASAVSDQVSSLAKELSAPRAIHEQWSGGVCLVVVGVTFYNPETKTFIRHKPDPTRAEGGSRGIQVGGDGKRYVEWVYGSGFLVSRDGHVLTNRHVVDPWWQAKDFGRGLLQMGFRPMRSTFFACFPGGDPIALVRLADADDTDLAVARLVDPPAGLPVLPLPEAPPASKAGDPVVLLGYPEGVQGLVNRLDATSVQGLGAVDLADGRAVIDALVPLNGVRPTMTQGLLSDVTQDFLVNDAASTGGGSGGPLLSHSGVVIGVNAAVSGGFAGASYAIPIDRARPLLARAATLDGPVLDSLELPATRNDR
jgi:S1-C subfamily serine protease